MPEEFLHFIWIYQLFDHAELFSEEGERIQVLSAGQHNHNSGPDFNDARIIIDGNLWVGNVEIHVNTSDWFLHQHQFDPAYSNVILHVVFNHDKNFEEDDNLNIPVLKLKERIDMHKFYDWQHLKNEKTWIPCEASLKNVPAVIVSQMIERAAVDRLERKVNEIKVLHQGLNDHWEYTLMQVIITSFGSRVNREAFRTLAAIIPFTLIKKWENDKLKIEALLYGIAGFLDQPFIDSYPLQLKNEFDFLNRKYAFRIMRRSAWKFMRMRPPNFPTIRIAQLAVIFSNWTKICRNVFYELNTEQLETNFRYKVNPYWFVHYRFEVESNVSSHSMGKANYTNILINSLSPFLYAYGKYHNEERFKILSLRLLEDLGPEQNSIINRWKNVFINGNNALETQGLIELKNNFCSFKKCLSCKIGVWILNSK